jgi:hypothetical protein
MLRWQAERAAPKQYTRTRTHPCRAGIGCLPRELNRVRSPSRDGTGQYRALMMRYLFSGSSGPSINK